MITLPITAKQQYEIASDLANAASCMDWLKNHNPADAGSRVAEIYAPDDSPSSESQKVAA